MIPIRGDKSHVRILENGAQVAWAEITNITDSESTSLEEYHFVGASQPTIVSMMKGFEGQINGLITNPEVDDLMQRIRDARKSQVNEPVITLFYVVQYPGGIQRTFRFTQVEFVIANRTLGGANEPISRALAFRAKDCRVE